MGIALRHSGAVKVRGSGGFRRPGDVVPGGEAVGHRGAIVIGGEPMAAGRKCGEITLNTARNRWAEPGMRNRFMARSRWRVGWCEFSARVVQVPRLPVLDRRHNRPMRRLIASELVGDQHPRYLAMLGRQVTEEPLGGLGIPARLDEDVEDVPSWSTARHR